MKSGSEQRRTLAGFTLVELMVVVCIIGLLASVAASSFTKYIKTAKTVEAHESLYKIRLGAREYFIIDHWNGKGQLLVRQFPTIVDVPAAGPYCARQTTSNMEWINGGWDSLIFALDEAHYYRYSFQTGGKSYLSKYTAYALGDLDCDKVWSTFMIRGHVDGDGVPTAIGPIITKGLE